MKHRHAIETIMGGAVILVAAAFVIFAYQASDISTGEGYEVVAEFNDVTGISKGSDVKIGGVKVGVVNTLSLDERTYQARLALGIRQNVELPVDTTAAIVGDGLLGNKFVSLEPGADTAMLREGGKIEFTQSSVSLEELIGKFVFSGGGIADDAPAEPNDPFAENDADADGADDPFALP
jgi:phospholipid/cholesterol/gamma-HCH transport system substrate-binding protein